MNDAARTDRTDEATFAYYDLLPIIGHAAACQAACEIAEGTETEGERDSAR